MIPISSLEPDVTMQYVVLAYELTLGEPIGERPDERHSQYRGLPPEEIVKGPQVHATTKAYIIDKQNLRVSR